MECGLSLLIGCWLIVSHLGTDGWSPPVTLSRQRPGKPGRQQMAREYHLAQSLLTASLIYFKGS